MNTKETCNLLETYSMAAVYGKRNRHTYCRNQQFELWISVMDIICWYRQLVLLRLIISVVDNWNCRTLLISTIGIVNITNTNCRYWQSVLGLFMYYWYRPLELSISVIGLHERNNTNCRYSNCWSAINCWCRQFELSILTISIKWRFCLP